MFVFYFIGTNCLFFFFGTTCCFFFSAYNSQCGGGGGVGLFGTNGNDNGIGGTPAVGYGNLGISAGGGAGGQIGYPAGNSGSSAVYSATTPQGVGGAGGDYGGGGGGENTYGNGGKSLL